MNFKAIYMHTKPFKNTKNMQILTNYIKETRFFQNVSQMTLFRSTFQKLPKSYFAKMKRLDVPDYSKQYKFIKITEKCLC